MQTIVNTKQGAVEGFKSQDGKTIIFKGVPYAQPPVGGLRFRRPREHEPWDGVRSCKEFGNSCPQADLSAEGFYAKEFYDVPLPELNEDCLYLNIWTPEEAKEDSKLPVMFWIHGGAFMHGFGGEKEFDGEGFAKKGVILVTVNYRVNAFGFFAHLDLEAETPEGVSGNYGILDQLFALQWVRDNISSFGGSPEKVAIFGQSAGCMSVQCLISSPLSRGLFRGAILQSGGGLRALHETPGRAEAHNAAKKLMEHLGVSSIEELRQVPAGKLRDAAYAAGGPGLSWTPHVDGWLLPASTDELAESGEIHDIAYMIGSLGDDIGGNALLQDAAARWCQNQLKLGRRPAYMYFFDRKLPGDDAGAFHSGELWYLFETMDRCWRPWEEHDWEISRLLSGYWANFAKNLDPNGTDSSGKELPRWEPYTAANESKLEIR